MPGSPRHPGHPAVPVPEPRRPSRRPGWLGPGLLGSLAVTLALVSALAVPHLAAPGAEIEQGPDLAAPPPRPPLRDPGSTVDRAGERLFFSRDETPIRIACADCHLVTPPGAPPPDDLIRPGHTVYDAFGRGNWWNGRITTDCGEAGEVCLKRFMGGREMSGRMRTRLVEYMKSLGAPYGNPFVLRRKPPGLVAAGSGDPEKGRALFRRACHSCHPDGGAGQGPDLTESTLTPHQIADLIRVGQDPMPFYQADILDDDQVAHLAAYTYSLQPGATD